MSRRSKRTSEEDAQHTRFNLAQIPQVSPAKEEPTFKFVKTVEFIYQCRKPLYMLKSLDVDPFVEFTNSFMMGSSVGSDKHEVSVEIRAVHESSCKAEEEHHETLASRRKVSKALLGMAMNNMMAPYFINNGGLEAVFRLIRETRDVEVLTVCAGCLAHTTALSEFIVTLLNKRIIDSIVSLIEHGNEEIRFQCARSLTNLSTAQGDTYSIPEVDFLSLLTANGSMHAIQLLFSKCKRSDAVSYTLLALSNIASGLVDNNNDIELCVRHTLNAAKRLDILNDYEAALLLSEVVKQMSRIPQFTYLLSEEGILNVLLAITDQHARRINIIANCTESIVNLSLNPKNRRKIVLAGMHSRMLNIFAIDDPRVSTNLIIMVSNLMRAGVYHDKIAKTEVVHALLRLLTLSAEPSSNTSPVTNATINNNNSILETEVNETVTLLRTQFIATAQCASEMAKVDITAAALVQCNAVSIALRLLLEMHVVDHMSTPYTAFQMETIPCLWSILASLSMRTDFLRVMMRESALLEAIKSYAQVGPATCRSCVAQILLYMSMHLSDANASPLIDQKQGIIDIVFSSKQLLTRQASQLEYPLEVSSTALLSLIHLAENVASSRSVILADNLLNIIETALPIDDSACRSNVFCVLLLLYTLSKEETLCIKMLEAGVHRILVLHGSYIEKEGLKNMTEKMIGIKEKKGKPKSRRSLTQQSLLSVGMLYTRRSEDLIAATILNLSLKRGTLGEGVLNLLLNLLKNCKSSRCMWIARCLAYVSVHARAKLALTKESRLVGIITGLMRNGCEDAEKALLFSSVIICNFTAQPFPKATVERMVRGGEIIDLVVVTLLRVSTHAVGGDAKESTYALSQRTKETLGKALFNLLSRADARDSITKQGVFEALVDLSKVESVVLLELSMRAVYNISLETSTYSAILVKSGVPLNIVEILSIGSHPGNSSNHNSSNSSHQGAYPTHAIKLIAAKALANISFNLDVAIALSKCSNLADALFCIQSLESQEATYCACAIAYNLSIPETSFMQLNGKRNLVVAAVTSTLLSNRDAEKEPVIVVTLFVSVIKAFIDTTAIPALCCQLAVATLCNLSLVPAFQSQFASIALVPLLRLLISPKCGLDVKTDVVRFSYNLLTSQSCEESKVLAIKSGIVPGILNVLKLMTEEDESIMTLLGSILVEICGETSYTSSMLLDGVVKGLVRLSKIELPSLKLNVARALLRLTFTIEGTAKILSIGDGANILFWLTVYDCLSEFAPILANVARVLKNYSLCSANHTSLVKEERLFSVLQVLCKTGNEDILWHTGAAILNILKNEDNRALMIKRGIVPLVFGLAAGGGGGGYESVRYLCSASLHCIPEALPDMKDPTVLPLVLCLLEINEDKQSKHDPDTLSLDEIHAPLQEEDSSIEPAILSGSVMVHLARCFDFENSPGAELSPPLNWVTMTCDVDHVFQPVRLEILTEEDKTHAGVVGSNPDLQMSLRMLGYKSDKHSKLASSMFGDFKGDLNTSVLEEDCDKDYSADARKIDSNEVFDRSPTDVGESGSYENDSFEVPSVATIQSLDVLPPLDETTASSVELQDKHTSPMRATSLSIPSMDTVAMIKQFEYSPARKPRSGTGGPRISSGESSRKTK